MLTAICVKINISFKTGLLTLRRQPTKVRGTHVVFGIGVPDLHIALQPFHHLASILVDLLSRNAHKIP